MSVMWFWAVANNCSGEIFQSNHTPPDVKDYITDVYPGTVKHQYICGGMFFEVDTTDSACVITAAQSVAIPQGEIIFPAPFAEWHTWPCLGCDMTPVKGQQIVLSKGEHGAISLHFGIKRPPIIWQGFDPKNIDIDLIRGLMRHYDNASTMPQKRIQKPSKEPLNK